MTTFKTYLCQSDADPVLCQRLVEATASVERHVCRRNVTSNVDWIVGISTSYQLHINVGIRHLNDIVDLHVIIENKWDIKC